MEMISREEMDRLFAALISKYLPPVTEIKPSEIEKLEDFEKVIYQRQYSSLLQIYVKPLEKLVTNLLNRANKEKYSYNVDNLSILEMVALYGKVLRQSGYTKEQLISLVPKTEEETDLLAKAINNGFDDSNILDNETRISEARYFLENLGKDLPSGRRVA